MSKRTGIPEHWSLARIGAGVVLIALVAAAAILVVDSTDCTSAGDCGDRNRGIFISLMVIALVGLPPSWGFIVSGVLRGKSTAGEDTDVWLLTVFVLAGASLLLAAGAVLSGLLLADPDSDASLFRTTFAVFGALSLFDGWWAIRIWRERVRPSS